MARVFRMKFVPTIKENGQELRATNPALYESRREDIFKKFDKYHIIGTGFGESGLKAGMDDASICSIAKSSKELGESRINLSRALCSITTGDLIWMLYKSTYYLFRVSENLVGSEWCDTKWKTDSRWFRDNDISSCFTGQWQVIGDAINVPGVVSNSMGIGPTLMELKNAPMLSQRAWNKATGTKTYALEKLTRNDLWSLLTDRQIEGLVLTYIQFTFNCMVNTESLKHSTADYECELVGKDGKRYFPQVKAYKGKTSSGIKEYETLYNKIKDGLSKCNPPLDNYTIILFIENGECRNFKKDDLIILTKEDLWKFMKEHKLCLSANLNSILELYSR